MKASQKTPEIGSRAGARLILKQPLAPCLFAGGVGLVFFGLSLAGLLSGFFVTAAAVFILITAGFLVFVAWVASFRTELTESGICHQRLFGRWSFLWKDIRAWGIENDSYGERDMWFQAAGMEKRRYVPLLDERRLESTIALFTEYCGDPEKK
jgi:hypothetical protein